MGEEQNPYAAPLFDGALAAEPVDSDAEQVRTAHLAHETSLRSWGGLYVLMGGGAMVGAVWLLIETLIRGFQPQGRGGTHLGMLPTLLIVAICGSGGAALVYTGRGLWRLRPAIRPVAVTLSFLGLLLVPIGTIIHLHLLHLLLSKKGRLILSPQYAEILKQTAHMRYQAPMWNLIVVVLFIVGLVIFFGLLL